MQAWKLKLATFPSSAQFQLKSWKKHTDRRTPAAGKGAKERRHPKTRNFKEFPARGHQIKHNMDAKPPRKAAWPGKKMKRFSVL